MNANELFFMQEAVNEARKSRDDPSGLIPRVGAIAVRNGQIIGRAFRGQDPTKPNDHAEYTLLEHVLDKNERLNDAVVYTTLEPCTHRGPGKTPCVDHLLLHKVGRVVIGMLDPNPVIRGVGFRKLRSRNIPTEVFSSDLMTEIEALNCHFISRMENHPIHIMTQEIGVLISRCRDERQAVPAEYHLAGCLGELRKIEAGEIRIIGPEATFFEHWLARAKRHEGPQSVRAYIRLPAFKPEDLLSRNWFSDFYRNISDMVHAGRLTLRYIYLLATPEITGPTAKYLEKIKTFAEEIRVIGIDCQQVDAQDIRPSIVLFETQEFAFTHDRADNAMMLQASEWIKKQDFDRLSKQYRRLELASTIFHSGGPSEK